MLEEIGGLRGFISGVFQNVKDWWIGLTIGEKQFTVAAFALTTCFIAGGLVLEGFLVGALTNAFFWYGFWGPGLISFMQKAGWMIDAAVTVGVMFIGGTHAMIAGVFIAGIFSACRRILVPAIPKVKKVKAAATEVAADVINVVTGPEPVAALA